MCGIVGVVNHKPEKISRDCLITMRDTMIHRGPDGEGVWLSENQQVGFGHRRLAIIDPASNASQPMQSFDKQTVICFNGEIYNHQELREQLKQQGVSQWQTDHSDTEVLLNAYRIWGRECVHHLRGMFAFAIWDAARQQLFCARDRLGIKPFYYLHQNGHFIFASEIKAILKYPGVKRHVNETALYHYLSFLTSPAPDTLFQDIKKLPPGHCLTLSMDGRFHVNRYWDVYENLIDLSQHSESDIVTQIRDTLRESVQYRKIADVPTGVFLSGGIDSSTNAALFAENDTDVHTFSIGYQGEYKSYQNELHYAKQMADTINAKHYDKLLTQDDLINFLPKLIHLQDEPIADPVCVPVYYVAELAKQHGIKVCQVGEGADELFWGYPSWKIKLRLQQLNQIKGFGWMKTLLHHGLNHTQQRHGWPNELLRRSLLKQPVFWGGAEAFTESQKQWLLSSDYKQRLNGITSWDALAPIFSDFQQKAPDQHWLNWMSYCDLNYRLPELLLMRVDKMTMGVSLESRVPFLDHKMVELAMSIPAQMKTQHGNLKYMLKQAVRGLIPDQIIDRKKQGFGVPVYEWFFDKLGDKIKQTLKQFCHDTDYFDPQMIEHYLASGQGGQIWYLFNFALWWNHYIAEKPI